MKIGIIGVGEIGSALKKCYVENGYNVYCKDFHLNEDIYKCDFLNICIPYSKEFVSIVINYIKEYRPEFVIIHSTVKPGTTKEIINLSGLKNIVHSPVNGVHPNLYDGLITFRKFVGSEDEDVGKKATKHFEDVGLDAKVLGSCETTEMAKILCTTYYGMCIAWHNEINKVCKDNNLDFYKVMTEWNRNYNSGYTRLNKSNVVRPVLYPPENGKIGGHCVIPNAEICKTVFESPILDFILKLK